MQNKVVPLQNRGMNRDTSISKASNEFAFENHNIRITARDHDTLISVTNERGNKKISGMTFSGDLVGWNVLNKYLILFTVDGTTSYIYRVEYTGTSFLQLLIFSGQLGFDTRYPIESVVDYETEDSQKIYWVDGNNVLRFLNFSNAYLEKHFTEGHSWSNPEFDFKDDPTWFDSTRPYEGIPSVSITKDNGGNSRNNGTAQYFLTYYNEGGQETGIVYSSPLVYLSPMDSGGEADGKNNNRITLTFSGLDKSFEYARLYQIVRTSYNGEIVGYIVSETSIANGKATLVDAGNPLSTVDANSIMYLGSQEVKPGTLTHKDGTLFLGDLQSIGNAGISGIEEAIKESAFVLPVGETSMQYDRDWESKIVSFSLSNSQDFSDKKNNIPYVYANGYYPYENQLKYTNAQISTFKGGEKYRFALRFYRDNGTYSKAFWIGDKVNPYYPQMTSHNTVKRAIAVCSLPDSVITAAYAAGFSSVQILIAQASYADRSVQAQGIVNPTMFNLYDRYADSPYTQASWNYRAKGGNLPFRHLASTLRSDNRYAELQTSWWDNSSATRNAEPSPLYFMNKSTNKLANPPYGYKEYDDFSATAVVYAQKLITKYWGKLTIKYYVTGESDPKKTYEFDLGGGSEVYNNSRLKFISDWLNAYDTANLPAANRATRSQIDTLCKNALDDATPVKPGSDSTYSVSRTTLNFASSDMNMTFSKYNREYFFVDENVVTLNSPEIEYNFVNVDNDSALKFRIVGAARMTSNISDYLIETEDYEYPGNRVLKYNFSKPNISKGLEGLSAWPLYLEYGYTKSGNTYTKKDVPFAFMSYMWHKSGSIPVFVDTNNDDLVLSILTRKLFGNLHYAYYSIYNNYGVNEWSVTPGQIRQIGDTASVYNIKTGSTTRTYSASVDELIVMPEDTKYPIYYSEKEVLPAESLILGTSKDSADPIHMSYKTRPHALVTLPKGTNGETILPYIYSEDAFEMPTMDSTDSATYTDPTAPWMGTALDNYTLLYRLYSTVGTFSDGAYSGFVIKEQDTTGKLITMRLDATSSYANWQTYYALSSAMSEINKTASGKSVFVHTISSDNLLANVLGLTLEKIGVTMAWNKKDVTRGGSDRDSSIRSNLINTTNDTIVVTFESNVPMKSITYTITGTPRVGSTAASIVNTVTVPSSKQYSYQITSSAFGSSSYSDVRITFAIEFTWEYGAQQKVVPDLSNQTVTISAVGTSVKKTYNSGATFYKAEYIDPEDPLEEAIQFLDLAYSPNRIIELNTSNTFTFVSNYTTNYPEPIQSSFNLSNYSFIPNGSEYLYIGELYKDYDALAASDPKQDSRYGGISESAVEKNIFIPAGPRTMLTDREIVDGYASTVLNLEELYDEIATIDTAGEKSFSLKIASGNAQDPTEESISLYSLSNVTVEDVLPTSTDKTTKLIVVPDNGSWKSDIDGLLPSQKNAIAASSDYKIAVLRFGFARRGKWRKYVNKNGETQSSHTTRPAPSYKYMRRGYSNGLDACRMRIIGYDLLISSRSLAYLQSKSSTFFDEHGSSARPRIDYNAPVTLISSLGDTLVLPEMRKRYYSGDTPLTTPEYRDITGDGLHFSNKSRNGLSELFIGLYHKENGEWRLASNIVQVRGRSSDHTKIWEFDTTNEVYSVDDDLSE